MKDCINGNHFQMQTFPVQASFLRRWPSVLKQQSTSRLHKSSKMGGKKIQSNVDLMFVALAITITMYILLDTTRQTLAWKHDRNSATSSLRYWQPPPLSGYSPANVEEQQADLLRHSAVDQMSSSRKFKEEATSESKYNRHEPSSSVDELATSSSASDSSPLDGDESEETSSSLEHEDSLENAQESPERNMFLEQHRSQLQAMHDLFERRQLNGPNQLQASQELNPIAIGLDPVQAGPPDPAFLGPFPVSNREGPPMGPLAKAPMGNPDNLDQGLGPGLAFGLPHLMGFQSQAFDGPQRGDQSAHSNHHHADMSPTSESDPGPGQKIWPKIFRFTDGRINLADFEKQKKIRLSNKNQQHNGDNHIESAPVIFDGRQLKRKSFLILHGGIFSR